MPTAPIDDIESRTRALAVATVAFERFTHGLATGQWQPFLDMLTEDIVFWFPTGAYRGEHRGCERARAFFAYVAETFPQGLEVTLERVTASDATVVFEFHDHGMLRGVPYENRVALSLDVRGDRISAYREYFGLIGS